MLEFHEYADIFPLLEGAAFDELVADIRENGLREPIVLLDDKILDGRNRYRAAVAAGVIDQAKGAWFNAAVLNDGFREFGSEAREQDPLAFVVSKNLHRRHLTESQRAMVGGRIANMRSGARTDLAPIDARSDAQAAAIVSVSERSIERAKGVLRDGVPALGRAVERGDVKVSAAAAIATLEPAEQEAALVKVGSPEWKASVKAARDQQTAMKKARRAIKERALGEKQRALPNEKFGVILADPEWKFEVRSEAGLDRAADNHYPTSPAEVIMARPVREIAADDCVLFLWSTPPHERTAMTVLEAWGFTYKSQFVWVKEGGPGTGYWNRGDHETLLVGTRGKVPCPAPGENRSSVLDGRKGRHSEKPEAAYELIEDYFPSLPKIELNARSGRPGWTAWGNEAPEAGAADEAEALDAGGKVNTAAPAPSPPAPSPPAPEAQVDLEDALGGDDPAASSAWPSRRAELLLAVETSDPGQLSRIGATIHDLRALSAEKLIRNGKGTSVRLAAAGKKMLERHRADAAERAADAARLAELPDTLEGLAEAYGEALKAYDFNVVRGNEDRAAAERQVLRDILVKANGGTHFGVAVNDAPQGIVEAHAAPNGAVPLWGQHGRFVVEAEGVRAIVVFNGYWGLHACDTGQPFPSNTGFRSPGAGSEPATGTTVEDYARALLAGAVAGYGKKKLDIPERVYVLEPGGRRELRPEPPFERHGAAAPAEQDAQAVA